MCITYSFFAFKDTKIDGLDREKTGEPFITVGRLVNAAAHAINESGDTSGRIIKPIIFGLRDLVRRRA